MQESNSHSWKMTTKRKMSKITLSEATSMSDGEGSLYDQDSDKETIAKNKKRRRKEKEKTTYGAKTL
jgi:hypothetical protein